MDQVVVRMLLSINRAFYSQFASDFSATRLNPQPGYELLADKLPVNCRSLLDAGCGNGRLGRFLIEKFDDLHYTGLDSSDELLAIAQAHVNGTFIRRDLAEDGCLDGLGTFDVVCCLATLQHIPGVDIRGRLVRDLSEHLNPGAALILSAWQFPDSARQMRKVVDWSTVGLVKSDVEKSDYLMTWGGNETALRYVAYIDRREIAEHAAAADLQVKDQFRSDGREGDLNLYAILRR